MYCRRRIVAGASYLWRQMQWFIFNVCNSIIIYTMYYILNFVVIFCMNLPHPVSVFSAFGLLPADLCLLFATAPLTALCICRQRRASLTAAFFASLQKTKFSVCCPTSLGKLVLIEVDKKPLLLFPEDAWFPCKVKVTSPEGDIYNFPIHRWICGSEVHLFREGTGFSNWTTSLSPYLTVSHLP